MNQAEGMEEDQLGEDGSGNADPPVEHHSGNPWCPGEEADKQVEPRGLCDPVGDGEGDPGEESGDS